MKKKGEEKEKRKSEKKGKKKEEKRGKNIKKEKKENGVKYWEIISNQNNDYHA